MAGTMTKPPPIPMIADSVPTMKPMTTGGMTLM